MGTSPLTTPSQPLQRAAALGQRPGHTDEIVEPGDCCGARQRVQGELAAVVHIEGDGVDALVGARTQRDPGGAVDGQGEDEAVVVVGVLADEVDASRRADDVGGRSRRIRR